MTVLTSVWMIEPLPGCHLERSVFQRSEGSPAFQRPMFKYDYCTIRNLENEFQFQLQGYASIGKPVNSLHHEPT
jgi:hypothetical protein